MCKSYYERHKQDVVGLYDRCPPRKVPTSQREYITISQLSTSPALEELLDQFPLKLLGFHSDNGPEYINKQVAGRYSQVNVNLVLLQAKHALWIPIIHVV